MCPQGNIGSSGYHTDQIDAIVIRYHSGQILVSSFVPEPGEEVVRGDFRMWDEFEPDTPAVSENNPPAAPDENAPTPPTQPNPVTDVQGDPSISIPESTENTSPVEILPDTPPNHTTVAKNKVPAPDITSDTEEATSEDAMSKETISEETARRETITRKRLSYRNP